MQDYLEKSLEAQYAQYRERRDGRVRRVRVGKHTRLVDVAGEERDVVDMDADLNADDVEDEKNENPLLAARPSAADPEAWFKQAQFANLPSDSEDEMVRFARGSVCVCVCVLRSHAHTCIYIYIYL